MSNALAAPFEIDLSAGRHERRWAMAAVVFALIGIAASDLWFGYQFVLVAAVAVICRQYQRSAQRRAGLTAVFYADGLLAVRQGNNPPLPATLEQASRLLGVPTLTLSRNDDRWSAPLYRDRLNAEQDHRLRLWLAGNPAT